MKDALAPAGIINGTLCADVNQCPYTTIQFSPLLLVTCCRTFWVVTPLLMRLLVLLRPVRVMA
jgi:hypothetical protein